MSVKNLIKWREAILILIEFSMKEEALDRTMWRNRFGRGVGPVVRQITDWIESNVMENISGEFCMANLVLSNIGGVIRNFYSVANINMSRYA